MGTFDDSILLNTPGREFLWSLLARRRLELSRGQKIVDGGLIAWNKVWKEAALHLKLPPATLYVLRHTGPSDDRLRNRRSLDDVQKRGAWLSRKSVLRYEKAATILKVTRDLDPRVVEHIALCERNLAMNCHAATRCS